MVCELVAAKVAIKMEVAIESMMMPWHRHRGEQTPQIWQTFLNLAYLSDGISAPRSGSLTEKLLSFLTIAASRANREIIQIEFGLWVIVRSIWFLTISRKYFPKQESPPHPELPTQANESSDSARRCFPQFFREFALILTSPTWRARN